MRRGTKATGSGTVRLKATRRENRENQNRSSKKLKSSGSIFDANPGSDLDAIQHTVRGEVFLAAHRVKHQHARTIYINSRLQQELADYIATRTNRSADLPLFPTHRGPRCSFSPNTLAQHFYWLYRKAGVSNASSHSGRKTFLTSLASQGVSVFVLASLAGHKSISTTQRYITVNDEVKRRAVELV